MNCWLTGSYCKCEHPLQSQGKQAVKWKASGCCDAEVSQRGSSWLLWLAATWPPSPRPQLMPKNDREDPSMFLWGEECVSYSSNQTHVLLQLWQRPRILKLKWSQKQTRGPPIPVNRLVLAQVWTLNLPWIPRWSCFNLEIFRSRAGPHLWDDRADMGRETCAYLPSDLICLSFSREPHLAPFTLTLKLLQSYGRVRGSFVCRDRETRMHALLVCGWWETPAPHAQGGLPEKGVWREVTVTHEWVFARDLWQEKGVLIKLCKLKQWRWPALILGYVLRNSTVVNHRKV